MGTSSKCNRVKERFQSAKPIKQWCKARGLVFSDYIQKFSLSIKVPKKAQEPKVVETKKKHWWQIWGRKNELGACKHKS